MSHRDFVFHFTLPHILEIQLPSYKGHELLKGHYLVFCKLKEEQLWQERRKQLESNERKVESIEDCFLLHGEVTDWMQLESPVDQNEIYCQIMQRDGIEVFPQMESRVYFLFKRGVKLQKLLPQDLAQS